MEVPISLWNFKSYYIITERNIIFHQKRFTQEMICLVDSKFFRNYSEEDSSSFGCMSRPGSSLHFRHQLISRRQTSTGCARRWWTRSS